MNVQTLIKALQEVPNPSATSIALDPGNVVTTATGEADTELFTSTAHGLAVGDSIRFQSLTGGTGLSVNTTYFIKTVPDANSFTLSASKGGATAAFSTDVTACIYARTDLNDATVSLAAATEAGIDEDDAGVVTISA